MYSEPSVVNNYLNLETLLPTNEKWPLLNEKWSLTQNKTTLQNIYCYDKCQLEAQGHSLATFV